MKPSQPVEMTNEWLMFLKKQMSIHWGQRILKVYKPNKPNRYKTVQVPEWVCT